MFFNKNTAAFFILFTFLVTYVASEPLQLPPKTKNKKRTPGCFNESTCAARGGATCFPPAGTNPCMYDSNTPSPCGKLVRCASNSKGNSPYSNPDCGSLIARQGTKVCPSASAPDSSWYGCFSTNTIAGQQNIGAQIMKPLKNAAHSVNTGAKKVMNNVKGVVQKGKDEIHYRTSATQQQAQKHSEKWNPRIDRLANKADDHFYKGDLHLATARSYVDQGGVVKKTAQEQKANEAQYKKHYAKSQVSYAKAIGVGHTAIAAKKVRDTTFRIPGLRGHR
ncbi:uncharacterized protein FA14DRAFT_181405 [Meira miltonrushii]|uniref:Uncharacterized protein n=1 Tax=Meira miltonrushii TaxID=1280837 RepID=A0A316V5D7_9BASI|nr:uncharacterized protein FA14DRAFT_181405 [Meira miltonrushii]PWN32726.1 hypothetical protein FA14DRAFT_181405 [Meira miltonrushii]